MDPEEIALRRQRAQRYWDERAAEADAMEGYAWWHDLTETERREWMAKAGSSIPLQCWEAHKRESQPD